MRAAEQWAFASQNRIGRLVKAVFLVTTVLGLTALWPAIVADAGATALVTANATRLRGAGRSV